MLVAEQLFLLLRRDDGRAEVGSGFEIYGLTGALLTDLVTAGHLTLSDDKDPVVHVTASGPVGHPVLDAALDRLRAKDGRTLSRLVLDTSLSPGESVVRSLVAAEVIGIEPKRMLGLVPARYPVRDPGPERALRERLRAVLAGATPAPNEAALLGLLKGLTIAGRVLKAEKGTLGRRELDHRINEVTGDAVVGTVVSRTIEQMQSVVTIVGGSG
jgi:hypothetical protein